MLLLYQITMHLLVSAVDKPTKQINTYRLPTKGWLSLGPTTATNCTTYVPREMVSRLLHNVPMLRRRWCQGFLSAAHALFRRKREKKKQGRSVESSSQSGDERGHAAGPIHDEAKARRILEEEVLVEASRSQNGEAVVGFDPDDAALDNLYFVDNEHHYWGIQHRRWRITPMIYYATKGDAEMCGYLASRGASTTKPDDSGEYFNWPMAAAASEGHMEVCKVLFVNGAEDDVRRRDADGWTPFIMAANEAEWPLHENRDDLVRWLTLHGALCRDGGSDRIHIRARGPRIEGETDVEHWQRFVGPDVLPPCQRLVEWAKGGTQTHSALVTFLIGALPPAPNKDRSCLLQVLSGVPGLRKHICDFVGLEVTKRKQLRILRQVVDILPSYIY